MTRSTSVVGQVVLEVADGELPGGVGAAEVALHVLLGDLGEVLAALVGVQHALVADGAQQEDAQRAGADPASTTRAPGKMSAKEDLSRVLGVDHGGAAGHGQDELLAIRSCNERRNNKKMLPSHQIGGELLLQTGHVELMSHSASTS